jgi:hypothetical protein
LTIPKLSRGKQIALDFFLVFLFAAILIKPYFKSKYLDKWASIESTFISDARFLAENWPHPQWQPLWYAGTRFDYVYPPALRYGTAGLSKLFGWWPVKAYHFYVAFFYALGIAGVYLLIRIGSGSRGSGWLGAAATATMSPIFLLLPRYRADAWMWQPQRLGVLVKYGEGPHMTALALIPIALAFAWVALGAGGSGLGAGDKHRRWWAVALAGVFAAGVVSNNFYGATALAVFYPLMVWAFWITRQDRSIFLPAAVIPVIAYGLTAFWLVPSYFKVTAENMKYVAEHGTTWSVWVALAVAVAFAVTTDKLAKGKAGRTWGVFVAGAAVFFSVNVLGNIWFNFRVTGEPTRLLPELDMIYIMGAIVGLRWMWKRGDIAWRAAAGLLVLAAFGTTAGYLRHAWHMFPAWPDYQSRIEYRMSEWFSKNMPDARIYPSGSVRFWFNAWHDLAQVGGGSEQGLLNGMVVPAQWETNLGKESRPAVLWMQAMGADALYVSDQRSQEEYHDFVYPQKFSGALPVLYDDGSGNVLYGIARRYAPRVRVVETAKIDAAKAPRFNDDIEYLQRYVDAIEKGPDAPGTLTRRGTDAMTLKARVEPGQSVLVQESYDTPWRARSEGRELPLRKDAMGFMVIDAPPGDREIELDFVTPLENQIGRVVTGITLLSLVGLLWMSRGKS